jgi:mannose-6-phosphate isomerase-like protein (cupin superfamily)
MARAGQTIEGGVQAGGRIVFRKTARDTNGELLQYDRYMRGGGWLPKAHVHPYQEERFEVLSGTARLRVSGQERDIGAGETVTVPAGAPHIWGNPGEEEAHLIIEFRPALSMETFLETLSYAQKGGKLNLLQRAVIGDEYEDVYYDVWPPLFAQRVLCRLLAPIGRLLGYKARYPEYSGPEEPAGESEREGRSVVPRATTGVLVGAVVVAALGLFVIRRRVRPARR